MHPTTRSRHSFHQPPAPHLQVPVHYAQPVPLELDVLAACASPSARTLAHPSRIASAVASARASSALKEWENLRSVAMQSSERGTEHATMQAMHYADEMAKYGRPGMVSLARDDHAPELLRRLNVGLHASSRGPRTRHEPAHLTSASARAAATSLNGAKLDLQPHLNRQSASGMG